MNYLQRESGMNAKELLKLTESLTLLYVEDDDILRESTADLFKNFFGSVESAVDGLEALKLYEKGKFDIIISDILMPNLNGLEMSKKIKEQDEEQHIIIISAYNDANYFEESISIGIDGYIVKPLNNEQLIKELYKVSHKIHEHKQNLAYRVQLEEEIKQRTQEFKESLVTDRITTLPNRLALDDALDKEQEYKALLFNIDNFNSVNMGFGYDMGDAVLKAVSDFLQSKLDKEGQLYRIGADEFIYITQVYSLEHLKSVAVDIQSIFMNDVLTLPNEASVRLTLSAALAQGKADNLVKHSQLALYQARKSGKSKLFVYEENLPIFSAQKERIGWINKLRVALDNDLITPFFQPIVDNRTGAICKYETLARIVDNGKIITPNYFIEPGRVSGQITELTKSIIKKSFEIMADNDYEFSINIESEDLNENYLPDYIKHFANKYNIRMDRIVIEVLEHIHTYDEQQTLEQLETLKKMGVKIAIDDFGNEQSNFSRLLDIQADYIKIDGQFIKEIDSDPKSFKISSAITNLAKSLDAKIIAEFVHKKEVQDKILELGIDFSQGYYFGIPTAKIK